MAVIPANTNVPNTVTHSGEFSINFQKLVSCICIGGYTLPHCSPV